MTPPDREFLADALLLRLIERLHAEIWRRRAEQLDPALDLVDVWLDALAVLQPEAAEPRAPADPLLGIF